jgi:hypothetical protein
MRENEIDVDMSEIDESGANEGEIGKLVETIIENDIPITKQELKGAATTAAARYKTWLENTKSLECNHLREGEDSATDHNG